MLGCACAYLLLLVSELMPQQNMAMAGIPINTMPPPPWPKRPCRITQRPLAPPDSSLQKLELEALGLQAYDPCAAEDTKLKAIWRFRGAAPMLAHMKGFQLPRCLME